MDLDTTDWLAFSRSLATDTGLALSMLRRLPNSYRIGHAIALQLDLQEGTLPQDFPGKLERELELCGRALARPLRIWLEKKSSPSELPLEMSRTL